MANNSPKDYPKLSSQLDQIIEKLQDEQTTIEEALKLYEKGLALASDLENYLKHAKNKLTKISPKG